jgi:hypothetical protein
MAVWAIGNIGGSKALSALNELDDKTSALVKQEVQRTKKS